MNIGESVRQGDIYITKVANLPKNLVPKKSDIVLEGEFSGHAHKVTTAKLLLSPPEKRNNPLEVCFIDATEQATDLVHDEHNTIHLGTGLFIVTRQREFRENVSGFSAVSD